MDLYEELLGLRELLRNAGIEYAICGGIAVAFHGYPRFTKDIDLLILPQDLDRVRKAVENQGFHIDTGILPFGSGGPYEREIVRITKIAGSETLTLDLLLVNAVLQDVWEDRQAFEWRGSLVPVVSLDGLAKMKRLAGRDQDLLDLKKLGVEP